MVSPPQSSHASLRSGASETKLVGKDAESPAQKSSRSWSVWGNFKVDDNTKKLKSDQPDTSQHKDSSDKGPSTKNPEPNSRPSTSQNSVRSTENSKAKSPSPNESPIPQATTLKSEEHIAREPTKSTIVDDDKLGQRKWYFWSRPSSTDNQAPKSEIEQIASPPSAVDIVTNKMIPFSATDAILYKGKSNPEVLEQENVPDEENPHPNIVLPGFEILPHQTTWTNISTSINKLAHRWNLISENTMKQKCLYQRGPQESLKILSDNKSRPIKVLIVGVHGFFPTKMIRPFIGEPTGTSVKFISEAEKVVNQYFQKYDMDVEISKIALEREGEVYDRVNFFYDVMKNWAKEINQADFVYFVAHSQGCPVTILLLAKLIDSGIINSDSSMFSNEGLLEYSGKRKLISILAMAGINNGPFYGADQTLFVRAYQTIEKESLRELFQFQKFDSPLSRQLIRSIRIIIRSGVKIAFIGSINDQLVPLYSSICLFAHHPNIFRATFIDSDSRTPSFIKRLVNIAGTLIDLGYDDHGIIKEISASLAGRLTGGGHSTVYNEAQVYEMGLKFALETSDCCDEIPVDYRPFKLDQLGANPFHLPWCMRGLLYETGKHLDENEIHELFKEFEEWEPETKQLKDMKYRLNGLKSKL